MWLSASRISILSEKSSGLAYRWSEGDLRKIARKQVLIGPESLAAAFGISIS